MKLWKKEQSAFKVTPSKEVNGSDDSKEQLIAQVEHYKGVLGETVSTNCVNDSLIYDLDLLVRSRDK